MAYGLGIDVGTTFTGAALAYDTHVEMLPLGETALVAPSVVFSGRDGQLLTGEAALRLAEAEPGRAVREFKRRLGDPIPIILGNRRYTPTELIAAVVRDVVARAKTVTGADPSAVVLTCPAIWGPYRLEQFTEVPALAGLPDCRVVTEPEAAVAFYRANRVSTRNELMAVYDLGGGTFDTAIMRASGDRIELVGNAEGVDGTGGVDLDQVVIAMVDEQLGGAVSRLEVGTPTHAAVLARLQADAVRAKEALSSESVVVMPFFLADGPREVRLTRAEFEQRIGHVLDPTIEAVWRALASAGLDPSALDAILLSGGSSRVPLVTRRIEAEFARPVHTFGHPKHVVALGAAGLALADARARGTDVVEPAVDVSPPDRAPARSRPPLLRLVSAGALALVTIAGLFVGAIWLSDDRPASGPTAPLAESSTQADPQPSADEPSVSPSPQPSPVASTSTAPGGATVGTGACAAAGGQAWEAGYLGVASYAQGGMDGVRQGTFAGQPAWLVGPSYQLSRWSTRGRGYIRIGNAYLALEPDGELALYRSAQALATGPSCAAWRTGTSGQVGAYLRFQPDGNLVLYAANGQPLWASNTCCDAAADTFVVRADGTLAVVNLASQHVYWSSSGSA
jgi:molecular chaperone DnaK